MTTNQNNAEMMRQEILADAQRESEEILLRAKREAERLMAAAASEADRLKEERLRQAREEAARRSELILATVSVETGRLRAARTEGLLESIREEIHQRLRERDGFEYREVVIALASQAVDRMEGALFVAKVPEADRAILGNDLADEIARHVPRPVTITISYEQDLIDAGVVVEDGETRQVWDNRLVKRLERLWPELRREIAVEASLVPKIGSQGDGL